MSDLRLDSILAKAGDFVDKATGAVVPPIHPATTVSRATLSTARLWKGP